MPRRRAVVKREILPDPLYKDETVAKFVNHIMVSGKKSLAEKIVYGAFDEVKQRLKLKDEDEGGDEGGQGSAVLDAFNKALDAVRPSVEVKSRRVGGSTYQIPVEVRPDRRTALAMRWLVDSAKKRSEKTMVLRLANEMLDALAGRGSAVKKREDTHRMAQANQAFAHYRW